MIVPMKKALLISSDARKVKSLEVLRDFGLLHVEELKGLGEKLEELKEKRDSIDRALFHLPESEENGRDNGSGPSSSEAAMETARRINRQVERKRELEEERDKFQREREKLLPWGDFDPRDLDLLEKKGLSMRLFTVSQDDFAKRPEELLCFTLSSTKSQRRLACIGEVDVPDSWQETPKPESSLSRLEEMIEAKEEQIAHIQEELKHLSNARLRLNQLLEEIEGQIEFENILTGMHSDERIVYLQGFLPGRRCDELKKLAADNGLGLLITDPSEEDRVPTLVENRKAISIIQPVFDMLGTIPGYRERDISSFFLVFLSIFFAMIIGDAGYGLVFFVPALIGSLRGKQKNGEAPKAMVLLSLMGFFTLVWGTITGTWFGSQTLAELPPLKALTIPAIASFSKQDSSLVVKYICFVLGTVHLSIAHIWNFITEFKRQKPRIRAFAQLGWLSMVLGLFYLVLNLVLSAEQFPMPQFSLYMIFGGLAAVFIFGEQEGNFFKGIGKGVAGVLPTFLDSISAFSDIISYIRLFAVGLASVEIAKSFNSMAAGLDSDFIGIVGAVLILLLGHALNLAMGALSVVVHGIRLNMLEFSGHLGMEWTGVAYDPFKNKETK